ncbi:transporter [Enterococcus termitis]|uniref:Transporter n=1 Tax=Enterococcus termitis TaxID=332950 RepID=A0A1E5GZM8_9ENTE|nr:transporter [Enterococcus termitis]OEG18181.1 transporter [Enterococcus termitis]OJG97218.1 hypothetical protein RV18_GL001083 [Enterococcus termitis]
MEKTKLPINLYAGILDIINAVLVALSWLILGTAFLGELAGVSGSVSITSLLVYGVIATGLALHIVGLIQSRKAGISIVGHILGVIAAGLFLLTMFLALPSFILFILSAVFTLIQKNVTKKEQ